jgi:hypothetical protein
MSAKEEFTLEQKKQIRDMLTKWNHAKAAYLKLGEDIFNLVGWERIIEMDGVNYEVTSAGIKETKKVVRV